MIDLLIIIGLIVYCLWIFKSRKKHRCHDCEHCHKNCGGKKEWMKI